MPEGPEIRLAADQVAKAVAGKVTDQVFFAFDRLKSHEGELTVHRVEEVTTRGNAMLPRFEGGLSVYSHNQLYGQWRIARGDTLPKTKRQLRFAITAGPHRALLYSPRTSTRSTPQASASTCSSASPPEIIAPATPALMLVVVSATLGNARSRTLISSAFSTV